MLKPKIKAVIFDLGGVVAHGVYLDFLRHYCHKCLTSLGKERLADLERQVNMGLITENKFYREIEKVFGVNLTPRQMHEMIVRKMKADKRLVRFIPKLKKAKVAMFTNSIGHMAREVLRRRRIPTKKLFMQIFDSSQLHLVKPDSVAYRYVLRK